MMDLGVESQGQKYLTLITGSSYIFFSSSYISDGVFIITMIAYGL